MKMKLGRFLLSCILLSLCIFSKTFAQDGANPIDNSAADSIAAMLLADSISTAEQKLVNRGYGLSDPLYLGSNISVVKGSAINYMPVSNFEIGLQGQAAGLNIQQASGALPGSSVRAMIRGTSSIFANTEPLYIVDGVPVISSFYGPLNNNNADIYNSSATAVSNPLNYINPQDIESVSVLKDAEAKAFYGARGANGVILITTKTGKRGKDQGFTTVNYNVGFSTSYNNDAVSYVDGSTWLNTVDRARANAGINTPFTPAAPLVSHTGAIPLTRALADSTNTNWKDYVYRSSQAVTQELNLATTKGFAGGSFSLSSQYRKQESTLTGGVFTRFGVRASADFDINKNLIADATFQYVYTENQKPLLGKGLYMYNSSPLADTDSFGNPITALPFSPVTILNPATGDFISYNTMLGNNISANLREDSKGNRLLARNDNTESRTVATTGLKYKIIDGLTANARLAFEYILNYNIAYQSALLDNRAPATNRFALQQRANEAERSIYNTNIQGYVNFTRRIKDVRVDATAGIEFISQNFRRADFGSANGVITNPARLDLGNAPINQFISAANVSYYPDFNLSSIYSRGNVSYKDKYLFGLTLRSDRPGGGFTNSAASDVFHAISAGWIVSNEKFMKENADFISLLKIRVSTGVSGNMYIPSDYTRNIYGYSTRPGQVLRAYDSVMFAGNQAMQWERVRNADVGLDVGFLENRIIASVGYYYALTQNMLMPVNQVPAGYNTNDTNMVFWTNTSSGQLRNSGWEFNITSTNIETNDFKWTTSFNFTTNANEILSLDYSAAGKRVVLEANNSPALQGVIIDRKLGAVSGANNMLVSREGGSLGTYYLAQYAGIDKSTGLEMIYELDKDVYNATGQTVRTGNVIRATEDNVMNNRFVNERKTGAPTYYGGFSNTFTYKGFDLTAHFTFQGGNYIYDFEELRTSYVGNGTTQIRTDALDTWTPQNPNAAYPALVFTTNNTDLDGLKMSRMTDRFLHRADFIRFRTLQLGWTMPENMAKKIKLKEVRAYAQVHNLFTYSPYRGFSPEIVNTSSVAYERNVGQGMMYGSLPQVRTFNLGLTLTF
jgi:TonB-linked SusC/RagA family outer membrane protein